MAGRVEAPASRPRLGLGRRTRAVNAHSGKQVPPQVRVRLRGARQEPVVRDDAKGHARDRAGGGAAGERAHEEEGDDAGEEEAGEADQAVRGDRAPGRGCRARWRARQRRHRVQPGVDAAPSGNATDLSRSPENGLVPSRTIAAYLAMLPVSPPGTPTRGVR